MNVLKSIIIYCDQQEISSCDIDALSNGQIITIGSGAQMSYSFPQFSELAPHHFSIRKAGNDIFIRDENSPNGVIANGARLKHAVRMRSGVIYEAGPLSLMLQGVPPLGPCENVDCNFIFPEPLGFAAPVEVVAPVVPTLPVAPAPVAAAPVAPVQPVQPVAPTQPVAPVEPVAPAPVAAAPVAAAPIEPVQPPAAFGNEYGAAEIQTPISVQAILENNGFLEEVKERREMSTKQRKKQLRRLSNLAFFASMFMTAVMGALLYYFKIYLPGEPEVNFEYFTHVENPAPVKKPKVEELSTRETMSPPSPSFNAITAVAATSPISFVSSDMPGDTMGSGGDIGIGFGSVADSLGTGIGESEGAGLGSGESIDTAFVGEFWDLKRDRNGKPSEYAEMTGNLAVLQFLSDFFKDDWKRTELRPFFKSPVKLYATCFLMPNGYDEEATNAYDPTGSLKLEKSRWVIVYRAQVQAPKSGRFRFFGASDSVMGVRFNKKNVLESGLHDMRTQGWNQYSYDASTRDNYFYNSCEVWNALCNGFVAGDEFTVEAGEWYDMEVMISEIGGGMFGFCLMLEDLDEEGVEIPTAPGWKIPDASKPTDALDYSNHVQSLVQSGSPAGREAVDLPVLQLFRTAMVQPDVEEIYSTFKFMDAQLMGSKTNPPYDPDSLVWRARPMKN